MRGRGAGVEEAVGSAASLGRPSAQIPPQWALA